MRCTTCSPTPPTLAPTPSATPASERRVDDDGRLRARRHRLPQDEWEVLITDHHRGFIDWDTYQANQVRIGANTRPKAHQPGTGAVREGCALLQGLATCGTAAASSPSTTTARPSPPPATTAPAPASWSRAAAPGICASAAPGSTPRSPRRSWPRCSPPRCRPAWPPPSSSRTATTPRSRSGAARSSRPATGRQAERRYRAVDPDNRLVARGLETEWNTALQALADAEAELARREAARPKTLTPQEKSAILALGDDLAGVWTAPTTTDKDRKQLLRTLLDEVNISVHRDHTDAHAELMLRWKGGAITELTVPIKRTPPNRLRTDEDTVDLVRRLAAHYPDADDRRTSSTGKAAAPPADCRSPPVGSSRYATTTKSPATHPPTTHRKENCSP